jgi:hypothetical protein
VAISSGGCCFPYRAVCSDQSRDDKSTSQSYFYYEIAESAQWGWTLIAALAALLGVYLGGGLLLARRADGAGAPHPHAMRFRELQGMVRDGVRFAASAGKAGARRGRKVKFTGLTQTLGQLQQSLIGILSQTAELTLRLWVNPVNFRFGVGLARVGRRTRAWGRREQKAAIARRAARR